MADNLDSLLELLRTLPTGGKVDVVNRIAAFGEEALPTLRALLQDSKQGELDRVWYLMAMRATTDKGSAEDIAVVQDIVVNGQQHPPAVVAGALRVLETWRVETAVDVIGKCLQDERVIEGTLESETVKAFAVKALRHINTPAAKSLLA